MSRTKVFSGKGSTILAGAAIFCTMLMFSGCGDDGNGGHTHTYDNWTTVKEPSCTEAGLRTRNCSCGDTQSEPIARSTTGCGGGLYCELENSACLPISVEGVNDCNLAGGRVVTVCGDDTHTHTWGGWVVTLNATCNASGLETRTCTENTSHTETRTIPQLTGTQCETEHTHTWGGWVVTLSATCNASGIETRTCTENASHTETRTIPQLTGTQCETEHTHTWGGWVVTLNATCDAAGIRTRTCQTDNSHVEEWVMLQLSGEDCPTENSGTFVDERDGKTYKYVTIGTQTWMAENLNYDTSGSFCYKDNESNCTLYGRLYSWYTVMNGASSSASSPSRVQGICPSGWHVPSDAEWTTLTNFVGEKAGTKLRSGVAFVAGGWKVYEDVYVGTDDYGFSALPGGCYGFDMVGYSGYWWSATRDSYYGPWCREMQHISTSVFRKNDPPCPTYISLRCLQD